VPNKTYYTTGLAHPTGTAIVRASYKNHKSIYKETTVSVVCNDMLAPAESVYIPLLKGRFIQIPYSNIAPYSAFGKFQKLMNDYYSANQYPEYAITENFQLLDGKKAYIDQDTVEGVSTTVEFLNLIRRTEIAWIYTHGSNGGLSINSQKNIRITASDILAVHDGFFNNCKLIFFAACSSANSSTTSNITNVMDAAIAKGAKAVCGFDTAVDAAQAQDFCEKFLILLSKDAGDDLDITNSGITQFEMSFEEALQKAKEISDCEAGWHCEIDGPGISGTVN
jgi:hypothetical protein